MGGAQPWWGGEAPPAALAIACSPGGEAWPPAAQGPGRAGAAGGDSAGDGGGWFWERGGVTRRGASSNPRLNLL